MDYKISDFSDIECIKDTWSHITIFGAGRLGKVESYELLNAFGFAIDAYYDNHATPGTPVNGILINDIDILYQKKDQIFVFICVGEKYRAVIQKQFSEHDISNYAFLGKYEISNIMESIESADDSVKHRYSRLYEDELYLKNIFKKSMGYELDLNNPRSFNEKLQWLKIHDRNSLYTNLVDKYEAKRIVAGIIGEEYIVPTYGIWNNVEEIDFENLPDRFVLKCTHDSGGNVICRDKSKLDIVMVKDKLQRCLKTNYYYIGREWPYKNVKPRIIAEKYLEDKGAEPNDYKGFNFNGNLKIIEVDYEQFINHKKNSYSTDWKHIKAAIQYQSEKGHDIDKPKALNEMLKLTHMLSKIIPQVRPNYYSIDNKLYFGEITLYDYSGLEEFHPEKMGVSVGEWSVLPKGGVISGGGYIIYIHKLKTSILRTIDYKFYCFNGEPKFLYVSQGLEDHATANISFVSLEWNDMGFFRNDYRPFESLPPRPEKFDEMLRLCRKLAEGIRFARVDLYNIDGQVFFSEITFHPCSGFMPFNDNKYDDEIGEMLEL